MTSHPTSTAAPRQPVTPLVSVALAIVLALAFGLRLTWILAADIDIANGLYFDMTWYYGMGLRVADGLGLTRGTGIPTAEWPPGYPLLVGAIFKLTGNSIFAVQTVNALLATLTCALVFELGRRLFSAQTGLAAAALLAVAPGDIYYAPLLLSEIAFTTALVGACVLFLRLDSDAPGSNVPPLPARFCIGLALGVATLLRGASVLFVAVFAVVWLARGLSLKATVGASAAVVLGLLTALLPWTVRNQIRMGQPIPLSTSFGRTLSHAHSPVESGGRSLEELNYRMNLWRQLEHIPQPQREIEINRAFTRDALNSMLGNPGTELARVPVRLANLYRHDHAALEWGRLYLDPGATSGPRRPLIEGIADRWFASVADLYFHTILLAAAFGMVLMLARCGAAGLLVPAAVLYFTLLHSTLFPGEPRYRYPASPFLFIAAAYALTELRRRVWRKSESRGKATE